jgi:hypothetical protein
VLHDARRNVSAGRHASEGDELALDGRGEVFDAEVHPFDLAHGSPHSCMYGRHESIEQAPHRVILS